MRIFFIGCVKTSEIFLKKLLQLKSNVVGVITKQASSFNADFVDLSKVCKENNIDFLYVKNINDSACEEYILEKKPDVIFCFGWSQLISERILRIPPKGVIGFHPADLPKNRGRHPIIWALALGLKETSSTFFEMNERADEGRIISKSKICINYEDDAQSLYNKILLEGCKQIENIVEQFNKDNVCYEVQKTEKGNVWRKRSKEDGKIDWRMSGYTIYNLVRALSKPYVGAHFEYNNKEYKVWKVAELCGEGYENIEYGKVIKVISDTHFIIKVADKVIEVLQCDPISLQEGEYL